MIDVRDRFETVDGSSPDVQPLGDEIGKQFPLHAFHLLEAGDAFDPVGARPPAQGPQRAVAYVANRLTFRLHGAKPEDEQRVRQDIVSQIQNNLALVERLHRARPIVIDLIPPGKAMASFGFPSVITPNVSGVFWDHPDWETARIGLRQERLGEDLLLVIHEMAHAIQALAFTQAERDTLYRILLRTYRTRAASDEVFAIYTEREFTEGFKHEDFRAPGVYGRTRQRWSEDHLMTRFVRNLYFPHKPLAGPKPPPIKLNF